jgi:hypothetical protein
MIDRTHDSLGHKVAAIIDDAIADLMLLVPTQSRDEACKLMACLAIGRIEDNEVCRQVEQFAIDSVWDVDDTEGLPG